MLDNGTFLLSEGRSLVVSVDNRESDEIDNLGIWISVYHEGELDMDSVILLRYEDLRQIYEDLKWENDNPHVIDQNINKGIRISQSKPREEPSVWIEFKEIYDILVNCKSKYKEDEQQVKA